MFTVALRAIVRTCNFNEHVLDVAVPTFNEICLGTYYVVVLLRLMPKATQEGTKISTENEDELSVINCFGYANHVNTSMSLCTSMRANVREITALTDSCVSFSAGIHLSKEWSVLSG